MRARSALAASALVACGSRTGLDLLDLSRTPAPASSTPPASADDAATPPPASTCPETTPGAPVTLSRTPGTVDAPGSLVVDPTGVYWSSQYAVVKSSLGGGEVSTLLHQGWYSPLLAFDGSVYAGGRTILRVPTTGGIATTLLGDDAGAEVGQLGTDGTSLYWLSVSPVSPSGIEAMALQGGTSVSISGTPTSLVQEFCVDTTALYFVQRVAAEQTAIVRVPNLGGVPTTLVVGQLSQTSLTMDAKSLYWFDAVRDGIAIWTVPKSGGAPVTLASFGEDTVGTLAVDDCHVYATVGASVVRIPVAGGTPTTLYTAPLQAQPSALAVDATSIYWALNDYTGPTSTIMELTPK